MGTWGMAPWSSDDYGELTDEVRDEFRKHVMPLVMNRLSERPGHDHPNGLWARIGLAIIVYQSTFLSPDEEWEVAYEAKECWKLLAQDREWLKSWRNPRAFAKMFEAVGEEIDEMIKSYGKRPGNTPLALLMFADVDKRR